MLPAQPTITSITDNPSTTGIYTVAWGAAARADQYRLEENPDRVNWNEVAVQAGRSWTTPQARPNGMYTYRVRGCNAYGCGETSLLLAPASVDVAIPATLPMTPPQAFALAPDTIAPNLPVRFYWQAVPGAESYQLVARDVGCHPGELITVGVPANAVMPYRQPSFIPRCNNQIQDQVTLRYWVKACAAGVCSESSNTQDLYVGIEPRSVETVSETTYIHTDALRSPVAATWITYKAHV